MPALAFSAVLLPLFTPSFQETERPVEHAPGPHTFTYEVVPERARAAGWVAAGASDTDAAAAAARVVERRLRAWGAGGDILVDADHARIVVRPECPFTAEEKRTFSTSIASLGLLELMIVADQDLLEGLGTDTTTEQRKLEQWVEEHPGAPLVAFDQVRPEDGGPSEGVAWYPRARDASAGEPASELARAMLLVLPATLDDSFGAGSLERVYRAKNFSGLPTFGFELRGTREGAFGDLTERNIDRFLAFVLRGEVVWAPRIDERLRRDVIVRRHWTREEASAIVADLEAMDGPLRPVDDDR